MKNQFLTLFSSVLSYSIDFSSKENIFCQFNIIDFISQFNDNFNQDHLSQLFQSSFSFFIDYCRSFSVEWIPPRDSPRSKFSLESIFNFHIQHFQQSFLIYFRTFAHSFSKSIDLIFDVFFNV
jgi:hypothetical protein